MSTFDKDLKIGDIIRAYHKGIHRVTKIERRFFSIYDEQRGWGKEGMEYASLIYYDRVLDSTFKRSRKSGNCCDAAYCTKLNKEELELELTNKISELTNGYAAILELFDDK